MYKKQGLTICIYWVTLETTPLFLFLMTLLICVLPLEANGLFINCNIFSHNNSFSIHYICMFKEGFTLPVRMCKSAWSNVSLILHGKNFLNSQCRCTPLLPIASEIMLLPDTGSSLCVFSFISTCGEGFSLWYMYKEMCLILIRQPWIGWSYCTYHHSPQHCWGLL